MTTYPYPFYAVADPYLTTYIHRTFPEHHHFFEQTRQRISQTLHRMREYQEPTIAPHIDVRETVEGYFIDVDLPGLGPGDPLKLKWSDSRTLMLEATTKRRDVDFRLGVTSSQTESDAKAPSTKDQENVVHQPVRERIVGDYMRAFTFPCEVNRDAMVAELQSGVLSLTIPKTPEAIIESKDVHVKKSDA